MARCCVHADNRKERKGRIYRDDKGKEEESGIIDDEVEMLCERLSTMSSRKDERKRAHRNTSKILQKSKAFRKLEIIAPTNTTPRDRKPLLMGTAQQYSKCSRRFPSPRVMCKTPLVTKQAQFQGEVVAKKLAAKTTTPPEQTPNAADDD